MANRTRFQGVIMNVISVATWNKRFKYFGKFMSQFGDDFLNRYHFVVNMTTDDWKLFPQELKDKYKDKVEFNLTEINYGSTNKMLPILKYNNEHPVMIMDDDCLYNQEYIDAAFNLDVKNCIIGTYGAFVNPQTSYMMFERTTTCELFNSNPNKKFFKKFMYDKDLLNKPLKDVIFFGHGTVLYNPNVLKFNIEDFKEFRNADDELAFKLSLEQNVDKYVFDMDNGKCRSVIKDMGCANGLAYGNAVEDKERIKDVSNILIRIWKQIYPLCNFKSNCDSDKRFKFITNKANKNIIGYKNIIDIHNNIIKSLNLNRPSELEGFFDD